MKNKSVVHLCLCAGLVLLVAQLSLLLILLIPHNHKNTFPYDDIQAVVNITSKFHIPIFLIDGKILQQYVRQKDQYSEQCVLCKDTDPYSFAILYRGQTDNFGLKLLNEFQAVGFHTEIFLNTKPEEKPPDIPTNAPICYLMKRKTVIHLVLFYEKEGNFWWNGAIGSDPNAVAKLSSFGLATDTIDIMRVEEAYEKFNTDLVYLEEIPFLIPKDVSRYLRDAAFSHYLECKHQLAHTFHEINGKDTSQDAVRFAHRAWKLLSKAKTLLDKLQVRFWLSSGTCLGYYRQCDIIPYSRDVDLGIFISDYSDNILPQFIAHGFKLKHWFGRVNDSLEMSFTSGDIKLDIFFFYEDGHMVWNGGTQARTGKKFKYVFPRFSLCWTEFLGLKVRVPCETLIYIEMNYGISWFTPTSDWDWKTSPANVFENGVWPKNEWPDVVKVID